MTQPSTPRKVRPVMGQNTAPIRRAWATLFWERAYAAWVPALAIIIGFIGLSLIGLWQAVPGWLHALCLILTLAGIVWTTRAALRRFRRPHRAEAIARVEIDSDLQPGLLRDLEDRPLTHQQDDPFWQRRQERLEATAAKTRLGNPRALIDQTDPYGGRYAAILVFLVGLVWAGESATTRLVSSVVPNFGSNAPVMADIWISPPDYTRLPPRFLVRDAALSDGTADAIDIPIGSVLNIRLSKSDGETPHARVVLSSQTQTNRFPAPPQDGVYTIDYTLQESLTLEIATRGARGIWPLNVVADTAPSVIWQEPPSVEGGLRTVLSAETIDDFGIVQAELLLRLSSTIEQGPDAPAPTPAALAEERVIPVPAFVGQPGNRQVSVDLSDHLWAGLPVSMRLRVTDGAGASAVTPPLEVSLPIRNFYNPVAQTVIEQRRHLTLSPGSWRRTARILDALTFAPERFTDSSREYLLLRTAFHDVINGNGQNTEDVAESFWPLAIALEDENLTLARQRLEAAQAALREALARNAPQEEIDRLIENLRLAMNQYLAALSQSGDAAANANDEMVEGRDLDDILDEIARLRQQGDTDEARQRLSELEQMLQNMRISSGNQGGSQSSGNGQPGSQGSGDGSGGGRGGIGESLDAVGDLIEQQRRLSDETFGAARGDRYGDGLNTTQRGLAEAADALSEAAENLEDSQGDNAGAESFESAAQTMRRAAQALEEQQYGYAVQLQEQALNAMREGAQSLAETALADEDGDGEAGQTGEQGAAEGSRVSGAGSDRDPLGRRYDGSETGVTIPDAVDPERIRSLTDELRGRLSDPDLSDDERDYIERLLRRF